MNDRLKQAIANLTVIVDNTRLTGPERRQLDEDLNLITQVVDQYIPWEDAKKELDADG